MSNEKKVSRRAPSRMTRHSLEKVAQTAVDASTEECWVDYQPSGDALHQDMHYQERCWARGKKIVCFDFSGCILGRSGQVAIT